MSDGEILSSAEMRVELAAILGEDSILYRRLHSAIVQRDKPSISRALRSLSLYPWQTRRAVERVIMSWLFDPEDVDTLLPPQVSNQA